MNPFSVFAQYGIPSTATTTPQQFSDLIPKDFSQIDLVTTFYTLLLPIMILGGIVIGGIILARFYQLETSYAGKTGRIPNRHCFVVRGTNEIFHAWVNKVDRILAEETFQILKEIPEIEGKTNLAEAIDGIIKKIKSGRLFAYEVKIIDRKYMRLKGNLGYGLVISTAPLEDSQFHWEIEGGAFSPFSPRGKENLRVISCGSESRFFEAEDENRKLVPIWCIATEPDPQKVIDRIVNEGKSNEETIYKQVKFGHGLEELDVKPLVMEVHSYSNPKEMSEILLISHMVAEERRLVKRQEMEISSLTKMVENSQDKMLSEKYKNDYLMHELALQEIIKLGEKEIQKEVNASWGWILLFIMGTVGGSYIPQMVPQLSTMNPFIGIAIIDGLLAAIKYYVESKAQTPTEKAAKLAKERGGIVN